ncbi:MAG TPA: nucleotide exchange factor GrpE [Clostridiales bacterium]|nr:nucleotide exchange factor GrpE [Clostridiales bacterium]
MEYTLKGDSIEKDLNSQEESEGVDNLPEQDELTEEEPKIDDLSIEESMIEELNDKLLRKAAEFDNFRKRNEKEKSQMFEIGAKSIVEKILPVIDNFERGLETVPQNDSDNAFVEGMQRIYKQFLTCMEEAGVKPIEAIGKEFDPNFHNAVMHDEDPEQGENIVIEELQKGYMYKDSVVRYSMVKVVN